MLSNAFVLCVMQPLLCCSGPPPTATTAPAETTHSTDGEVYRYHSARGAVSETANSNSLRNNTRESFLNKLLARVPHKPLTSLDGGPKLVQRPRISMWGLPQRLNVAFIVHLDRLII